MDADVCIVGAGAAGGIMALEFGRAGVKVAVLESGPRHEFAKRASYARAYLRGENPWQSPLPGHDRYTVGGRLAYGLDGRRARGVGGSTLHWEGYALRLHADDFRLRSLHKRGDDWPLSYADLEPYYARAEAALGVAGVADEPWGTPRSTAFPLPEFPFSYSDARLARACGTLGIGFHHLPQARNSLAYAGRARCQACSTCHVCPTGAKASIDLTHVPAAESTGNVRIVPEANVARLETDDAGRVAHAIYLHPDRVERRLTARLFVLAAGGIENARLLLLSASVRHARGLANGSGLVGTRFMAQPSIDALGRVADNVYPYRIGFSTAMSRQFAIDRERSARAGFMLEFLNSAGPRPDEIASSSRLTGEALTRRVRAEFGTRLGIRIYGEHLPDPVNAITLNPRVKDYFGNPAPHIAYRLSRYEEDGLEAARRVARTILRAAGANDLEFTPISPAAHQIGTHRMGTTGSTSVVDPDLRAHDVDNLYLVGSGSFVTSSAAPPTLTIAALALRAAEHIKGRLRAG